jgi:DNA primase small subunit
LFPFDQLWSFFGREVCFFLSLISFLIGKKESREWACRLQDETFIRGKKMSSVYDWKRDVQRLLPMRLEIGGLLSDDKTVGRELIFDLDLNSYDDVRRDVCDCHQGEGRICHYCWTFMIAGMTAVDTILRDDFGFQRILWTYSGRRGVHAWVMDERAFGLSSVARQAIVQYMSFSSLKNNKEIDHPVWKRMSRQLKNLFKTRLFRRIQERSPQSLVPFIDTNTLPKDRWVWLRWKRHVVDSLRLILTYLAPRIDSPVTTGTSHLLKCPFSIHPSTGRICFPLPPKQWNVFQPWTVPTLWQLWDEQNRTRAADRIATRRFIYAISTLVSI